MANTKNKQEEEMVDRFLSSEKALNELKNSSEKDMQEIMEYGINGCNKKTTAQFAEDFLKMLKHYPNKLNSRVISNITKKIEVEEE